MWTFGAAVLIYFLMCYSDGLPCSKSNYWGTCESNSSLGLVLGAANAVEIHIKQPVWHGTLLLWGSELELGVHKRTDSQPTEVSAQESQNWNKKVIVSDAWCIFTQNQQLRASSFITSVPSCTPEMTMYYCMFFNSRMKPFQTGYALPAMPLLKLE